MISSEFKFYLNFLNRLVDQKKFFSGQLVEKLFKTKL